MAVPQVVVYTMSVTTADYAIPVDTFVSATTIYTMSAVVISVSNTTAYATSVSATATNTMSVHVVFIIAAVHNFAFTMPVATSVFTVIVSTTAVENTLVNDSVYTMSVTDSVSTTAVNISVNAAYIATTSVINCLTRDTAPVHYHHKPSTAIGSHCRRRVQRISVAATKRDTASSEDLDGNRHDHQSSDDGFHYNMSSIGYYTNTTYITRASGSTKSLPT